jgi:hypothetical protein
MLVSCSDRHRAAPCASVATGADAGATNVRRGLHDGGVVQITGDLSYCAEITLSVVGPTQLALGASAALVGHAQSADETTFSFAWSASAGQLSHAKAAETSYTCTSRGLHTLRLTATDRHGCDAEIQVSITCLP